MSNPKVYLAGPISGQTFEGASSWRTEVRDALSKHNIDSYSPLRGKYYLEGLGELTHLDVYEVVNVLSAGKGIMSRDYWDANRCDLMFINFLPAIDNGRISIGTCMEMAWAYAKHTPTIVVMQKEGNPHEHAMLQQATSFRVATIAEGIQLALSVLLMDNKNPNPVSV